MKRLVIACLVLISTLGAGAQENDLSQYGNPIQISEESKAQRVEKPETALDREISEFRRKHNARNALLINNSHGRALNKDGRLKGLEDLGNPVNPTDVMIIAEARVAMPVVTLYTSIKKLPESAHRVRILYTESDDHSKSALLGYTIENEDEVYTKLVKYDGRTPWLEWITKSFENDDAEHKKE